MSYLYTFSQTPLPIIHNLLDVFLKRLYNPTEFKRIVSELSNSTGISYENVEKHLTLIKSGAPYMGILKAINKELMAHSSELPNRLEDLIIKNPSLLMEMSGYSGTSGSYQYPVQLRPPESTTLVPKPQQKPIQDKKNKNEQLEGYIDNNITDKQPVEKKEDIDKWWWQDIDEWWWDKLNRFNIHSPDDFNNLGNFVSEKILQPIYQEAINKPEAYSHIPGEIEVSSLPEQMKYAVAINRVAIKVALYQLNANQSFILALKNEYVKSQQNKNNAQKIFSMTMSILSRCFPENFVIQSRKAMQQVFPDDYNMLTKGDIGTQTKTGYSLLFSQMPIDYNSTLQKITDKILNNKNRDSSYFVFISREGLGEILSIAYGGLYGDKVRGSYQARLSSLLYPNFFNRPVFLEPLSDKDKPFFPHNDAKGANQYMQSMESDILKRVISKTDELERNSQIDEEDALKVLFYISYSEASSEYLKESNLVRQKGIKARPMIEIVKNKFDQYSTTDPYEAGKAASFRYKFKKMAKQNIFANLGILKDLKTLSNPNYKPFTTIINDVRSALDNDRMQPQQALIELKNRIFTGPGSLVNSIDTLFRKAFHFSSSPESVKLYGNISALIKQLYDKLFSPFAAKLAVYDPAKYNELLNRLDGSLNIANQVEQSIKFLSTEMQSLKGIGSELPPRDQFEGPIPSMEQEEAEQKEEEADKTNQISSILSNFIQRLSNPQEAENVAKGLSSLKQILPEAADKVMKDPSLPEKYKFQIHSRLPLHMKVEDNLAILAEYAQKGSFGISNEYDKSVYMKMLNFIEKSMDDLGIEYVPENLEELLLSDPFLLGKLVSTLKQKFYGKPGKEKNIAFEEASATSALDSLKFNQDQFRMQQMEVGNAIDEEELRGDLDRFGIKSREDLDELAQFVYDNAVKPTYQEMIKQPYHYARITGEIGVEEIPPEMQKAVALNRAGLKFALYQMNSNQSFLTALKNEYERIRQNLYKLSKELGYKKLDPKAKEDIKQIYLVQARESEKQILKLVEGVLSRCFPEEMINAARASMQQTFPDDYNMLTKDKVEMTRGEIEGNELFLLFAKMPTSYDESIRQMAEIMLKSNVKNNHYFVFVSREGLGSMLSIAYGGLYGSKMRSSYKDRIAPFVHPNFFNRPVVLEPVADAKAKPLWPHNNVDAANQYMEAMESDIRFRVRNKIDELERSSQIDEEDALRALFYIAFTEASSDFLKKNHWARATGEEPPLISDLWKEKFKQLSSVDPFENYDEPDLVGTKQSSLYIFPLKYLFK